MDEQTLQVLERYLDGVMTPEELHAFEMRLRSETELRRAVQQQRSIDQALRRLVPAPSTLLVTLMPQAGVVENDAVAHPEMDPATAGSIGRQPAQRWLRRLAIAAVLAAGLFGVWSTWNQLRSGDSTREIVRQTAEAYYRDQVAQGLKPYYVCDPTSEAFAQEFRAHFGQGLVMDADVPGFVCAGVGRTNTLSPHTLSVLTRMNDVPVIVLIDRKSCRSKAEVPASSNLHLHSREIGSLVLYEVSPVDHPQVLSLFENADVAN